MHLLVIGSSRDQRGGVETFCERAKQALESRGQYRIDRIWTNTAYMNFRRLPAMLASVRVLLGSGRQRPDCVWLQYASILDLTYLVIAKAMGLKVLVTPHLGSNWRSQRNALLRAISATLLGLADRLALLSRTQELEIALPARVPRSFIRTFLPAAIWAGELQPESGGGELRLVHAGRLSEGKGTLLFVAVCARLKAAGMPFSARIAGGASEEFMTRLADMIAAHGLHDQVVPTGLLDNAALLGLLQNCDVLVHLSKIDSYPLIVLESIAYGVFPVCLDLAGARDMVTSYAGQLVSAGNPAEQAAAFLASQEPRAIRDKARQAAARVRADYRWDACVDLLEAALRAAMARGPEGQAQAVPL